jgi:hypothetical protein
MTLVFSSFFVLIEQIFHCIILYSCIMFGAAYYAIFWLIVSVVLWISWGLASASIIVLIGIGAAEFVVRVKLGGY